MYSNPKLPEGINTTKEHPLKEFSILLVGALLLIVAAVIVLGFAGGWLAGKIPFSAEMKIAALYEASVESETPGQREQQRYLQNLADRIHDILDMPEDMQVTVHYILGDTQNAFATLGGNIILYQGLLKKLPSENALAMLLGHEIAHIKYRHPIKSLGRGVAASIAIAAISGSTDSAALGEMGLLTTLQYTREMEQKSDEEAMFALHSLYGHIGGGAALFEQLQASRGDTGIVETPEFFSSHPLDQHRIDNFRQVAKSNNWKPDGELTPLRLRFDQFLENGS